MISFYPGPSRVHSEIPVYVKDAYRAGVLSINHRSEEFMSMSKDTVASLKQKLNVPENYSVFFTGSATECWEIIAQSLVTGSSCHIFNGAFGKKWFEYTAKLRKGARSLTFDVNEILPIKKIRAGRGKAVICITQNETSNGTQVTNELLSNIREKFHDQLIAVDATSSMAGIELDFRVADIWFASVQKCFGLPAGLGVMICSPDALKHARKVNESNHYNSLVFINEMMKKWQTSFTPNVLNIYLLNRVLKDSRNIEKTHQRTMVRYQEWMQFFSEKKTLKHLVENPEVRSLTVLPVKASNEMIRSIKEKARKNGILLGEGYGELKQNTFRIANFPAIKKKEIKILMDFLSEYE